MANDIKIRLIQYGENGSSLLTNDIITLDCGEFSHIWASIDRRGDCGCDCEVAHHPSSGGAGDPVAACVLTEILKKALIATHNKGARLPSSVAWRATFNTDDDPDHDAIHDYDAYTLEWMLRCYIEHRVYFKKPLDAVIIIAPLKKKLLQ